jgi:hypothetical protein
MQYQKLRTKTLISNERSRLACRLMYGDQYFNPQRKALMTFSALAKVLKTSIHTVRRLLQLGSPHGSIIEEIKRYHRQKLTPEHLSFLLHDHQLQQWGHKTLSERCILFHRTYPEVKISPSYLAAIYKKHGIKRKTVRLVKTLPRYIAQKVPDKLIMMRSEVKAALADGRKLVFIDEAMFTTAGRITHAYSAKKTNITIDERINNVESLAVVGAVSREAGLDCYLIKPKSINS